MALAMPYATAKSPVAILKYAKCTTKGNRIKIESNDATAGVVRYLSLDICDGGDGSFLIDVADVLKFISRLDDESVYIKVDGESMTIRHAKGSADFSVPSPDEYPSFAITEDERTEFIVSSAVLADFVNTGKGFVSTESLRPQMCAIYAYAGNGVFGYCASDTHVLINDEHDMPEATGDKSGFLIMPNVFAAILGSKKDSELCVISFNGRHVQYRFGNTIIQSTMANGNYPQFRRVIPQSYEIECGAEKNDIIKSVERVSMFCEESQCMKMAFDNMLLTMTANNLTKGKQSSESIAHNGCTKPVTIGMNAVNVLKCVKAMPAGEVLMRMTDESRPMMFKTSQRPNLTIIAMPMTITE